MKKKSPLSSEDEGVFRGTDERRQKLAQDTIVHLPVRKKITEVPVKRLLREQADASPYFRMNSSHVWRPKGQCATCVKARAILS